MDRTDDERRRGLARWRYALFCLLLLGCAPSETRDDTRESQEPPLADEHEGGEADTDAPEVAEPAAEQAPSAEPIACAGQEAITAEDITIRSDDGPAIRADGECQLTLTRAELSSGGVAVVAGGSARVTLRDSRVRGGAAAVVVRDEANVALPGTEVVGEVLLEGRGASDG